MKIVPVAGAALDRLFITMAPSLYLDDVNYIRPFDVDVQSVFDPKKNPRFQRGDCARWLLLDESGNPIGRIAAFFEKEANDTGFRVGGCGFFECINNQKAADLLFDTAKAWLAAHGMSAMDGPINFGNRERWWGLLVDGFHPPCYCCNYNPSYYQQLFERYGFQVYFKQFTYRREIATPLSSKVGEKALHALQDAGYTFSHIHRNQLGKAAEDFRSVYNEAWARHEGVNPMSAKNAHKLIQSMKPIIDPKIIWFAYYQGQPVGFWVNIPDVNQLIVKYTNGKLTLPGKIRFLWNRWRRRCKTMFGIVFGIVPEHQRKGLEAAMVMAATKVIQDPKQLKYEELQMNWIGDFNPKMMNVARYIGGTIYKTHHTYRYLFDRAKPFERHPIL
ncbi:hypothetical protein [Parapedobacter indicus]|uniref:N-acetyltransferase domain-containing protein n=1 Tax=Parapedobacter indicus TaxID=1477437 RepID=A0A1I3D1Q4_9SPHI|nr:hypothetical protein [Parapedobacter indicus]PPL04484.1 hypothetical protein CLV26_101286 [Parapedobacter indicus]SFH80441.1 hypothetical protein SAMN05444682_101273 [Parapedobacter indicus]